MYLCVCSRSDWSQRLWSRCVRSTIWSGTPCELRFCFWSLVGLQRWRLWLWMCQASKSDHLFYTKETPLRAQTTKRCKIWDRTISAIDSTFQTLGYPNKEDHSPQVKIEQDLYVTTTNEQSYTKQIGRTRFFHRSPRAQTINRKMQSFTTSRTRTKVR